MGEQRELSRTGTAAGAVGLVLGAVALLAGGFVLFQILVWNSLDL
ncbi:hypothetical protein [Kitasatospora indigofera]